MKENKAFTIIEIVAIIAIMAIFTSVSIISWAPLSASIKLKTEGDKVISILRQAQQEAVTEQINFAIRFRQDDNSYSLIKLVPIEENSLEKTVLEIKSYEISAPIKIKSVDDFIGDQAEFSSFGAAASSGTIVLENLNGGEYIVEVTAAGGIRKK